MNPKQRLNNLLTGLGAADRYTVLFFLTFCVHRKKSAGLGAAICAAWLLGLAQGLGWLFLALQLAALVIWPQMTWPVFQMLGSLRAAWRARR